MSQFRQWLNQPISAGFPASNTLDQYFTAMEQHGYDDVSYLCNCTEERLESIFAKVGITKDGHKDRLLTMIAKARSEALLAPAGPALPPAGPVLAPAGPVPKSSRVEDDSSRKKARKEVSAEEWADLGDKGGGQREGRKFTANDCYANSLGLNANDACVWCEFGNTGGGVVGGQHFSEKDCHLKSLELDPENAVFWYNCGFAGGQISFKGRVYSVKECYEKTLQYDPKCQRGWTDLGKAGGGTVKGRRYTKAECLAEAKKCQ